MQPWVNSSFEQSDRWLCLISSLNCWLHTHFVTMNMGLIKMHSHSCDCSAYWDDLPLFSGRWSWEWPGKYGLTLVSCGVWPHDTRPTQGRSHNFIHWAHNDQLHHSIEKFYSGILTIYISRGGHSCTLSCDWAPWPRTLGRGGVTSLSSVYYYDKMCIQSTVISWFPVQSNGKEPSCSADKWSSSKNDGWNFLTSVLAVTTVHMGVTTPQHSEIQVSITDFFITGMGYAVFTTYSTWTIKAALKNIKAIDSPKP